MTQDFFLGQLRLIMVAVIAFCAGKGWLSTDTTTLFGAILAPVGLLFGPWLWSIYHNINMKLVPKDSVAIASENVVNKNAVSTGGVALVTSSDSNPTTVAAKVVGMLLFACALSAFLAGGAQAQTPKLTGDGLADLRNAIADLRTQIQTLKSVSPPSGSVTADIVKRLTAPAAPSTPTEIDNTKCDFTIFSKLTFENVVPLLSKCAQMVNENVAAPLVVDAQHALDSATGFNNGAGDGAAIACLKPAVALLKAAEGFPAVKDANGVITTPAQALGIFLIGQKLREFVEAGGPSNCKTVITATANGLVASALTP